MYAQTQDIRVPSGEFLCEKDIRQLAVPIPNPGTALLELLLREEEVPSAGEPVAITGEADDADISVG